MQRIAIAAGRGEDHLHVNGIPAGVGQSLDAGGDGEFNGRARSPALRRGQQGDGLEADLFEYERDRAGQHGPSGGPIFQAWANQADALDKDPHQRCFPKIRLQLLPPKPNELLSAVSILHGSVSI